MKIRLILGMLIVAFLGFLIFLTKSLQNDPTKLPSVLTGKSIPAFRAPSLENPQRILTETALQGPALVNVWATWCPTCRSEHAMLNKLSQQGIKIYGINYKDDPKLAKAWLADLGNPYLFNVNDEKGQFGIDLGVYGAPETFFINHKGEIVLRHVGDINEVNWEKELLPLWQSIIASIPAHKAN